MQNRNDQLRAIRTETETIRSPGFEATNANSYFPIDYVDQFLVVVDTTGSRPNRKDVHSHLFIKTQYDALSGTQQILNVGPSSYYEMLKEGSFGIVPRYKSYADVIDRSSSRNSALSKLYEQIRSNVDLSVDFAQMSQTRGMFRSADNLVRHVLSFRRGLWKNAYNHWVKNPKEIGSRWLEYQYGWKPFAQDLYESTLNVFKATPSLMRIKGLGHDKFEENLRDIDYDGYPWTNIQRSSHRTLFDVTYAPPTSALDELANYTSLNPLSIAWELIPYSFVVDWVYDIGGYIRNFETALLSQNRFIRGYETNTVSLDVESEIQGSSNSGFARMKGSLSQRYKYRQRLSSNPAPNLPRFDLRHIGSGRLLNAAALLSQHLR